MHFTVKHCAALAAACIVARLAPVAAAEKATTAAPKSIHEVKVKDIDGKELDLGTLKGKPVLIVNVASRCGLTDKQYAGLETLYKQYKDKGLEIVAFPANNFGSQEPGSDKEIKEFCAAKQVSFKLCSKISVKGDDIHPLYGYLTSKESNPKGGGEVKWNFQKYLIGKDGKILATFEPRVDPMGKEVTEAIDQALKAGAAAK